MTELMTLQHNLTRWPKYFDMTANLPLQRLSHLILRPSKLQPSILLGTSLSRQPFGSLSKLRSPEKPEEPRVVYSRPTTLGGADRKSSPLRIWPFVLILLGGFYAFNQLIKERSGTKPAERVVKTEHPRG